MSMVAYRGFVMRDCFYLPYQGPKMPITTLSPKPDVAELAAAYGFGLAKNHPFNDANKRTALIAMRLFLKLNGYDLAASPEDKYKTIIRVAASDISEDELAQWIRKTWKR
jgi:death-on-curing protein